MWTSLNFHDLYDPFMGPEDVQVVHRIDPQAIVRSAQAAGFRLEVQSDLLRNPLDDHTLRVFDPAIRGRTDRVILKLRKAAVHPG